MIGPVEVAARIVLLLERIRQHRIQERVALESLAEAREVIALWQAELRELEGAARTEVVFATAALTRAESAARAMRGTTDGSEEIAAHDVTLAQARVDAARTAVARAGEGGPL